MNERSDLDGERGGISRRRFISLGLGGLAALGLGSALGPLGCAVEGGLAEAEPIPGEIVGARHEIGHLLREAMQGLPSRFEETGVLIVGGGIAGLIAAWELQQQGRSDFLVLELDAKPGGNAVSGKANDRRGLDAAEEPLSGGRSLPGGKGKAGDSGNGFDGTDLEYPWGAHYLPIPNLENKDLLAFLESTGCITGYQDGLPIYEELYLCHAPQERLLIHGLWQEGMVPRTGVSPEEEAEIDRFFDQMEAWKGLTGLEGGPQFTLPLDGSAFDPEWARLDAVSFADWLDQEGYSRPALRWYLNYCFRDEFGGTLATTSAWAGIHYFLARRGKAANAHDNSVLTWPQGNGWLVDQLAALVGDAVRTNALVYSLRSEEGGVVARVLDAESREITEVRALKAVYAAPTFTRSYVMPEHPFDAAAFGYSPWVVANVTVSQRPAGRGKPLSWDNVAYETGSLGYILSDHQSLRQGRRRTVLTWYKALVDGSPVEERQAAKDRSYEEWQAMVLEDLEWMHPGIRALVERIDVWVWGHGMIRPEPGFITGEARKRAREPIGHVHFAHSDLSGMSVFEEAFSQGLRAAREILGEGGDA